MNAHRPRLPSVRWPASGHTAKSRPSGQFTSWIVALSQILQQIGPDTTSATFVQVVERTIGSDHHVVSIEFMALADGAAVTSRSIVRSVRGTEPGVVLVMQMRHDDHITQESEAFVECLAHAASQSCPDLDDCSDQSPALVRRCRDLADQVGKARALLDFLAETSRTYLQQSSPLEG